MNSIESFFNKGITRISQAFMRPVFIFFPLLVIFGVGFLIPQVAFAGCGNPLDIGCHFTQGLTKIFAFGMYWVMQATSFLLYLAGVIFNFIVIELVFQFGENIAFSQGMLIAWGILRDLANMVLLFGFIYIGIAIMLELPNYTFAKTLPRLILVAVLLNFSLFITGAFIDTMNAFAASIYRQAQPACAEGAPCADNVNYGVAGAIFKQTGLGTAFAENGLNREAIAEKLEDPGKEAILYLSFATLFLITALVLFAASINLIARTVFLALYLVFSPLGFVGYAIPALEKHAKKNWTDPLISNALYAPVFVLLIFVALSISSGVAGAVGANDKTLIDAFSDVDHIGVIVIMMLVIGFVVAAHMMARGFGIASAGFASKVAGGATFGAVGFVGRATVGNASIATGKMVRATPGLRNTFVGRSISAIADKGAAASFDARQIIPKKVGGQEIDFGKAKEGGRKEEIKKTVDARVAYEKQTQEDDQVRYDSLEMEKRALEVERDKLKAKGKDTKAIEKKIAELQKKMDKTRAGRLKKAEGLEKEYEKQKTKQESLEAEKEQLEKRKIDLERQITTLNQQIVDAQNAGNTALEMELQARKLDYESQKDATEDRLTTVINRLDTATTQKDEKERDFRKQRTQIEKREFAGMRAAKNAIPLISDKSALRSAAVALRKAVRAPIK